MKEKGRDEKGRDSVIATNRQAPRDYFILETVEAGIALAGCEVKSLREAKANLAGSFARLEGREPFLYNLYIAPYTRAQMEEADPLRPRKLLLHRSQIEKLKAKVAQKGLALIPLKMYFNPRGIAKVELAVAKGKKLYDKRADIKKKAVMREMDRARKTRNRP